MAEPCPVCGRSPGANGNHCEREPDDESGALECYRLGFGRLQARLVLADRVAEAARSVKVSFETEHQQTLAAELLGALIDYDAAALLRRPN